MNSSPQEAMTSDSTHLTRTALIRSINRSQEESLSTVAEWVLLTLRARPPDPDRLYSTEVAWTWRISTTSQLGSLYDRTIKVGWAKFQSFMIWSTLQRVAQPDGISKREAGESKQTQTDPPRCNPGVWKCAPSS